LVTQTPEDAASDPDDGIVEINEPDDVPNPSKDPSDESDEESDDAESDDSGAGGTVGCGLAGDTQDTVSDAAACTYAPQRGQ